MPDELPFEPVQLVYTGDPVLTVVFIGLLFVFLVMLLEAGIRKGPVAHWSGTLKQGRSAI